MTDKQQRNIYMGEYFNELMSIEGLSREEALIKTSNEYGVKLETASRIIRKVAEKKRKKKAKSEVVGIIGDTHLPYELDGYMDFCLETFEREGVNKVVHIGDLIDNHSLSFHDSEPALKGSRGEYIDALERLAPWKKAFPELILIFGNHDQIPQRQLVKLGLDPTIYMRPMSEVYDFPNGWVALDEWESNGVLYHHGHTAAGVNGFRNDSKSRMRNTVTGHIHSNCGVSYTACDHKLVFGVATGCGVDNSSMAFIYGKHFKNKPVVGCAVIKDNGKTPLTFTMDLGRKWG